MIPQRRVEACEKHSLALLRSPNGGREGDFGFSGTGAAYAHEFPVVVKHESVYFGLCAIQFPKLLLYILNQRTHGIENFGEPAL